MHIVGLVWSGGYGVQRKVAGAEQVLRSPAEVAGMGADGTGRARRHRRRPALRRGRAARPARTGRSATCFAGDSRMIKLLQSAAARGVHARRGALQPRLRRPAQSLLPARRDRLLPVLDRRRQRPVPLRLLRDRRRRRLCLGRVADARPVVGRRHPAQRAPLRVGRDGADHAAAPAAPLRLRPLPRLALVLVGDRRGADLAGLRLGHQRLHAALGPAGAVRHRRVASSGSTGCRASAAP